MTYYSALHYAAKAEKSASEAALHNLKNKITNCITEIPQDIKLELNNGVLTLKAGSKVYVPNGKNADGSNKFDEVMIAYDLSLTSLQNRTGVLYYSKKGAIYTEQIDRCYSGSSYSGGQYGLWYDTTNNKIGYTGDSGSSWSFDDSLPLAICTVTTNGVTSIDQVFNGFGYIGSTVFALPGVKGLIPNGRNADGSLKNIEFVTDKVLTKTYDSTLTTAQDGMHYIDADGIQSTIYGSYDDKDNYNYNTSNNEKINRCYFGKLSVSAGRIENFRAKQAFNVVDYSDSSWIAQQAMPSSKHINLTLGASGSTYTAPANGYVFINKTTGVTNAYITIDALNISSGVICQLPFADNALKAFMPLRKGQQFKVYYNATGATNAFKFIYAKGEAN